MTRFQIRGADFLQPLLCCIRCYFKSLEAIKKFKNTQQNFFFLHFINERKVRMMKSDIIKDYAEKVYKYAVKRTYSRDEADELTQEILFTAVREFPRLREENKFEPWLWGIASNVTKRFRYGMGKQRAMYSYDMPENLFYEDKYFDEDDELYRSLREKIAMLSSIYRNVIILYYYDDLSTKDIAEKLAIPEGTVRWRLSEARKKIKKEYEIMETTALKPVKLLIGIEGEGNYGGDIPFPSEYIKDALSQNILYYCYPQPKTVEELSKLCGVPAYYVEERIANLIFREALSETPKGKYRTDFIIYSDKTDEYHCKAKAVLENVTETFVDTMKRLSDLAEKIGIYTAEKTKEELTYLYGIMALEHLNKEYNPIETMGYRLRYDGYHWNYHAHVEGHAKYHNILDKQLSANRGSEGTYCHYSYLLKGFTYRRMMYDIQINACEDILEGREIKSPDSVALAVKDGYVLKRNVELFVTAPKFSKEQYEQFTALVDDVFLDTARQYADAVKEYAKEYKKMFPAYLEDDVLLKCNYLFLELYGIICEIVQEKGFLPIPKENSVLDVLIQFK